MQITTMHTLTFTMKTAGTEAHNTAMSIIKLGADQMGVATHTSAMPLPAGEDSSVRNTTVEVTSEHRERLENFWDYAFRALSFIGVEAVSP